jgi:undecaprenyl-diphosphatase
VLATLIERILLLHGWVALAIVFLIPALEASAFLGFLFPGELAVLLGGVLAFQHRISLPAAIAAAVLGAIVGDTAGYFIGRRWGRRLLQGTLGRLPFIRHHLDRSLDRARAYLRRRKGAAVFFGRFTAALRVLIPGLAGMSDIHFPTFFAYNAAGGVAWGTAFVLLGYAAGAGWRRVERYAGVAGLVLLALVFVFLVGSWLLRDSDRLHRWGDRLAATPPLARLRRRFPAQVGWARRRLDPRNARGFPLTFAVAVAALAAWAFGGVTQDVVGHDESVKLDPPMERFILHHRTAWLTPVMKATTWLGSIAVLILVAVAVGAWFWWRRKDWKPSGKLALALGGAVVLYDIVKPLVGRARPPLDARLLPVSGSSFPSGHATQAVATYGMLALILSAGRPVRTRIGLCCAAGAAAVVVGLTRLYLGVHWLTDLLGGWALGTAWLALLTAAFLLPASGSGRRPRARPGADHEEARAA